MAVVEVANTPISYNFIGGDSAVRQMCAAMRSRDFSILPSLFEGNPPAELLVEQLYNDCNVAAYFGEIIWSGVDTGEVISLAYDAVAEEILAIL